MRSTARRTLVKSAPELWELASDLERMEAWMAGLLGAEQRLPVKVTRREPERVLVWRCTGSQGQARIAIQLAEKGFGTSVSITAEHVGPFEEIEAALEGVLDELASPERRPFSRR